MASINVVCFSCGNKMVFSDRVGLREDCDKCHADVHVCKNCEFYDPKVYNECREPSAEVIREKERSNYCDYFAARSATGSEQQKKQDLRAAAEALFKKEDS